MSDQLYKKNEKGKFVKVGPADYEAFRHMGDGVWIIKTTPGCRSSSCIAKVCDIPEHPYDFASIMCSHDDLCTFLSKYTNDYSKEHTGYLPSWFEMSRAILLFLAEKSGNRNKKTKKRLNRRIDLTL